MIVNIQLLISILIHGSSSDVESEPRIAQTCDFLIRIAAFSDSNLHRLGDLVSPTLINLLTLIPLRFIWVHGSHWLSVARIDVLGTYTG